MSRQLRVLIACAACVASSVFALAVPNAVAEKSNDPLTFSDADLSRSMSDIENDVRRQQAEVDSATQAMSVADQTATNSESQLVGVRANLDDLQRKAAESAVREYVSPAGVGIDVVLASEEIRDAEQRSVLLAQINSANRQAYANHKAAKKELDARLAEAVERREVANKRREVAQQKLDSLNALLNRKRQIEGAVAARQESAAAEDNNSVASGSSAAGRANRGGPASDDGRISAAGMKWPASGPVRSPFGQRWGRQHTGIDIGAPEGAPIYAAKGGTVKKASMDSGGYGNLVELDNGGGVVTYYAHMSRIATSVGATVQAGQQIGYIGHTGRVVPPSAAGAHLHFEVRIGGAPRNPQSYLP